MSAGITITEDQVAEIIRAEAERQIAARLGAMDVAQLAPHLDWMPAIWFAKQWGIAPKAFCSLAKKLGIKFNPASRKTKLYSVSDANAKNAQRALAPAPRRRGKIVAMS
jgi:hypothetical protein